MYKILGYSIYTSKKTGREKIVLHLQSTDRVIEGISVDKVIIDSERVQGDVVLGASVTVLYNRYGSCESVVIN